MKVEESVYHVPVLLDESVTALVTTKSGVYADATFGGGGHSKEMLSRLDGEGRLYGFDRDQDAAANSIDDPRFTFVRSNFRYMSNFMRYYGHSQIDGIIADLGVSWHHFDDEDRGFSFRFDSPLDMRMNRAEAVSAADLLESVTEERLATVFYLYGELRNGGALARAICCAREKRRISTTMDLIDVVRPLIGPEREKKELAKLFQALRMEVNHEVDALKELLEGSKGLLRSGGRLVVITYHSIEDRMVKNFMKSGNIEGVVETDMYGNRNLPFKMLGKPLLPQTGEQEKNPRSRSAKLRVAERR